MAHHPHMTGPATLPMYDWPEAQGDVDRRWARMAAALKAAGLKVPHTLTRGEDPESAWLRPDLFVGETCTWPLATTLHGRVRYLATEIHDAPGCRPGRYRSAIVARSRAAMPPPQSPEPHLPDGLGTGMTLAANSAGSLSGFRAPIADLQAAQRPAPASIIWTGSHRASVRAVADGSADIAAIDCVTWALAQQHEPAAQDLTVIGWTALRPALPLVTALGTDAATLTAMRDALQGAGLAVVHRDPLEGLACPL